jgi:hypothetical protein
VNVKVKVARFDGAKRSGFFSRFTFGGLTVREPRVRSSLWKSPLVAAIGVDQQELDRCASASITDGGYLQRQRLRNPG